MKVLLTGQEGVVITENFWVILGQPDVEIVFSQQQTTSADNLDVERPQKKLGEFESMRAINSSSLVCV